MTITTLRAVGMLVAGMVVISCGTAPQAVGSKATTPSPYEYSTPSATVIPSAVPTSAPGPTPAPNAVPLSCLGGTSSPSPGSTPQASPLPSPTQSSSPGAIAGHVTTPSEVIVAQLVYAISTAGASRGAYSTETAFNQATYTIRGIAPGTYYVYSARRPLECGENGVFVGASFSDAVKCGLSVSCTSHKPVPVIVKASATTVGIDPIDYYSPDGRVPMPPSWIVPYHASVPTTGPIYTSARAAAAPTSQEQETAVLVDTMTTCPVNQACTSVGVEHDGTQAAYFVGTAGSNGNLIACGAYVSHDRAGWHRLRRDCPGYGAVFPAVGQSGTVQLGFQNRSTGDCANVRSLPSPSGKVIACLADGAGVRLDGGPVYAPSASSDGVWWHIAGLGWMADDFFVRPVGP
jgi:hypothetical protein